MAVANGVAGRGDVVAWRRRMLYGLKIAKLNTCTYVRALKLCVFIQFKAYNHATMTEGRTEGQTKYRIEKPNKHVGPKTFYLRGETQGKETEARRPFMSGF